MQPGSVAIHTVQVFYYRYCLHETTEAIRTAIAETGANKLTIASSLYSHPPFTAHLPAEFMEKHTYEFVSYIGLGAPCC